MQQAEVEIKIKNPTLKEVLEETNRQILCLEDRAKGILIILNKLTSEDYYLNEKTVQNSKKIDGVELSIMDEAYLLPVSLSRIHDLLTRAHARLDNSL